MYDMHMKNAVLLTPKNDSRGVLQVIFMQEHIEALRMETKLRNNK